MRIVFMGTPEYSAVTLRALLEAGHEVAGVFAQPDKPVGRKQILTPPPVKVTAQQNAIPVFQPATLRDGTALEILRGLGPELIVVVAYGKILPPELLALPRFGCINGHASLLPKYRGASPIQWSIVCGERKTGVTVMQMDAGMDTGDILGVRETEIGAEETAGELFERLAAVSAGLTVEVLEKIGRGEVRPIPQDHAAATYAPILKKEMARLDFTKPADVLHNAVRGFNPWPGAFFFLEGRRIKVLKACVGAPCDAAPGTVIVTGNELTVACGEGTALRLLTVQPEGGRAMSAADLLRGHAFAPGTAVE